MGERITVFLSLGLITAIVLGASLAGYYYMKYQEAMRLLREYEKVTIRVNICLNYGNGTVKWYNNTLVPLGYDLLSATKLIAMVNSTYWESYQSYSVDAINGVWNNQTHYWMWLKWNTETNEWEYPLVSADQHLLSKGETVMWRYEVPSW
jgi:hypothetical protein